MRTFICIFGMIVLINYLPEPNDNYIVINLLFALLLFIGFIWAILQDLKELSK